MPSPSGILQSFGFILLLAAVLFATAGTIEITAFWAYLGVMAFASGVGLFVVDPDLAEERMRPGGRPPGLRLCFVFLLCLAHWAIAGLDRGRLHWSDRVPLWVQVAGFVVFVVGLSTFIWAMQVNRFFSSVVRIQRERGHHVVTAGPYRWVRHPGYAAAMPAAVASGLALGSWLAAAIGALGLPLILWRMIAEDRTLRAELPGYPEYARRVRWRLLPGVW
jgi:protein-S-isoprenylcysteine O-methyltransferase Ste14